MSSQPLLRQDDQQLRWPSFAIAAALALAILFGGGGAEGPINNGIILAGSAVLLFVLIAAHWLGTRPLPSSSIVPVLIVAGFLIVGAFQLIPISAATWRTQPGHEAAVSALQLVQAATQARPLSLDPEATRRAMAAMLLPAAMMLAVLGSSRNEVRLFVYTIIGCSLISAIIGALQLGLNYPAWLTYYEGGNAGSASGIFTNANHHGTLLLAAIVFVGLAVRMHSSAAPFQPGRRRLKFSPLWLLVPIFMLVIVATGSRAALLLLGLAVPVSVIIGAGRTTVKLLLAALLGVAVIVLLFSELSPAGNQVALGQSVVVTNDTRYAILPDVWFTLKQFWPTGSGFGTFAKVFALNEDLDIAGNAFINHAHNDLLEWLVEGGISGLIWILGTLVAIVARLVLVQLKDPAGRSAQEAFVWSGFFILTVVGLHSLADYPARMAAIAAMLGIALGLVFYPQRAVESRPAARSKVAAGLGVAILGGALIGLQTARMYAAQAAVRSGDGAAAVRIDRSNGAGLAIAADEQLQAHHIAEARSLASEAIRRSPLSPRAIRVLALARDIQNHSGMQAWRVASSMGWRDPPTQFWAMQQALLNHEYATAAIRADALLRTSTDPSMQRIGAIRALANLAPFRAQLIQRLSLEPRWSTAFFTVPAKASQQQLQGVFLTLTDLAHAGTAISPRRARSTIQALIDRKQFGAARALDALVARRRSPGATPDLSFAGDADSYVFDVTPFDWNVVDRGGTIVSIEQSGSERVLDLGSDGRQIYQPVRKYIALTPGNYVLGYSIRGEAASAASIRLAVYCAGSRQPLAASSDDPVEGSGFVHREFRFAVPGSCPLVLLAFEALRAEGPVEAQFADLSLDPA